MTTVEFSNQFDIHYNNIATNKAPGIDLYEKSVYLTKAQLEIVKNYYNPKGNKYQEGFESTEKRRNDLKNLIKNYVTSTVINSDNKISESSVLFEIPNDTFLIIYEKAIISSSDKCLDGIGVQVIPKTYDEYNIQINNPFKSPNSKNIWRLDYNDIPSKTVELISKYSILKYQIRYIKYPKPIILVDLDNDPEYSSDNLSIEGETNVMTCELSSSIHDEILDRAVQLAALDYKDGNLQSKVQLNNRNE